MKETVLLKLKSIIGSDYFRGVALLFLIQFFLFFDNYTNDQIFISSDLVSAANTTAPLKEFYDTTGEYPFWNPYIFSGMPAYESLSFNRGTYLPGEIITGLRHTFGLPWMFKLLMHVYMAGLFTFLFLKRRGLSQTVALFGGIVYMLNPYLITMIVFGHGSQAYSAAYIPLAFFAISELWKKPSLLNIGFTAAAVGFQLQSRHIQIVYYTWMMMGAYLLYSIILEFKRKQEAILIGKKFGYAVVALLLAFTLAAVLYLPVYSYSEFSTRGSGAGGGAGLQYATQWSFSPGEMMTFLIPSFYGFGGSTYWGDMPFTDYPNYMGILALVRAVYALVKKRTDLNLFLGIVIVLALLLSFGRHFSLFYSMFYNYMPFFNKFRVPAMALILVQFSVAILAAYGLEAIIKDTKKPEKQGKKKKDKNSVEKTLLYTLGGIGLMVIAAGFFKDSILSAFLDIERTIRGNPVPQSAAINTLRFELFYADFWVMILILLVFLGLLYYRTKVGIKPIVIGLAVIALTLIDLGRVDTEIIGKVQTRDASFLEKSTRQTSLVRFFRQKIDSGEKFRIFPVRDLFSTKEFAAHGIESIGGYHAAKMGIYQSYLDISSINRSFIEKYYKVEGNSRQSALRLFPEQNRKAIERDLAGLSMLNVRYVVSPYPMLEPKFKLVQKYDSKESGFNFPVIYVYEFDEAMSRAWLVSEAKVFDSHQSIIKQMRQSDFDPAKEVLLTSAPETKLDPAATGEVTDLISTPNKVEMNVTATGQMSLVISELYYPAGWRALLDGKEVEIKRANYLLRSIDIPPGTHTILMQSEPSGFTLGLLLTLFGYLILVGIATNQIIKRKKDKS